MDIRFPAVANMFYPGDPGVLHRDIQQYLAEARHTCASPKAIIVPHAGYMYSGQVAAQAFAQLIKLHDRIKRVILLGPCHRVPVRGLAAPTSDVFRTPLGDVAIDREAIASIIDLPQVQTFDMTHAQEHSLEVQIPFLQETLGEFSLVPLVVGDATATEVSEVLEKLWGGDETLIVISSDLSHYHDYDTACAMDSATCHAIVNYDIDAIGFDHACGRTPLTGLLESARHHNMKITSLDLRNSGDTAGSRDRVVGYGAWMLEENTVT